MGQKKELIVILDEDGMVDVLAHVDGVRDVVELAAHAVASALVTMDEDITLMQATTHFITMLGKAKKSIESEIEKASS